MILKFKPNKPFTHRCGCITDTHKEAVYFVKICNEPKHVMGNVWIIAQHPKEDTQSKSNRKVKRNEI